MKAGDSVEAVGAALAAFEKKIRNLDKRKTKLIDLKLKQTRGETLNQEQKDAMGKLEEVQQQLDLTKDLQKQFVQIQGETEKASKKQAKKERMERHEEEKRRIAEVVTINVVLGAMRGDTAREAYGAENTNPRAVAVTEQEFGHLDELYKILNPEREGDVKLEDKMVTAAEHVQAILDSKDKAVFESTTYKGLKELIQRIKACEYFTDPQVPEVAAEEDASSSNENGAESAGAEVKDDQTTEEAQEVAAPSAPTAAEVPSATAPSSEPEPSLPSADAAAAAATPPTDGALSFQPVVAPQPPVDQPASSQQQQIEQPAAPPAGQAFYQQAPPPAAGPTQEVMQQQLAQEKAARALNAIVGTGSINFIQDSELDRPAPAPVDTAVGVLPGNMVAQPQHFMPPPASEPAAPPPHSAPIESQVFQNPNIGAAPAYQSGSAPAGYVHYPAMAMPPPPQADPMAMHGGPAPAGPPPQSAMGQGPPQQQQAPPQPMLSDQAQQQMYGQQAPQPQGGGGPPPQTHMVMAGEFQPAAPGPNDQQPPPQGGVDQQGEQGEQGMRKVGRGGKPRMNYNGNRGNYRGQGPRGQNNGGYGGGYQPRGGEYRGEGGFQAYNGAGGGYRGGQGGGAKRGGPGGPPGGRGGYRGRGGRGNRGGGYGNNKPPMGPEGQR